MTCNLIIFRLPSGPPEIAGAGTAVDATAPAAYPVAAGEPRLSARETRGRRLLTDAFAGAKRGETPERARYTPARTGLSLHATGSTTISEAYRRLRSPGVPRCRSAPAAPTHGVPGAHRPMVGTTCVPCPVGRGWGCACSVSPKTSEGGTGLGPGPDAAAGALHARTGRRPTRGIRLPGRYARDRSHGRRRGPRSPRGPLAGNARRRHGDGGPAGSPDRRATLREPDHRRTAGSRTPPDPATGNRGARTSPLRPSSARPGAPAPSRRLPARAVGFRCGSPRRSRPVEVRSRQRPPPQPIDRTARHGEGHPTIR